jgi:hypothetical protein
MRDREWANNKIVMTVCQEMFWKETWTLLLGWTKEGFRSFLSYRLLIPCGNVTDFVERTSVQSIWEGAAQLGIPRTIAPPNERLNGFTYSHRFSSMDHVTWIQAGVLESALYCYSSFLPLCLGELPCTFFTDECAVHRSGRHCHVLFWAKENLYLAP